jgi:hypothetical protein
MTLEHSVRVLAGTLVLVSVVLSWLVSPCWLILGAFVGVNLIQSAFTKFCLAEIIIGKLFFGQPKQPH